MDGAEIGYQDKIEVATHTIKLTSVIGGRNPAHATGVGKALLAWTYSTDQAIRGWAGQWEPLSRPTTRTVKSADRLADELAQVREQGYALDVEENEIGVRCAAVPIFLGRQVPTAAVSITLLGSRAEVRRLNELGKYLREVVDDWSKVPVQ